MRLLLCLHDVDLASQVSDEVSERRHGFAVERADSFAELWRRLEEPAARREPVDAVLVAPGPKRLSFQGFLARWARERPGAKLLVLGDDAPGARRLEPGPPGHLVAQLYAALGLERSAVTDAKVVQYVGHGGHVTLELVEWPGAPEPVLRARLEAQDFDRGQLSVAQRHAGLSGPGLAPTLECFWDDRHPHTLHLVPPGVPLTSLRRSGWRPTPDDALALVRELAVGVRTAHEAGASAGWLDGGSVWVGADGAVSLLGVQLSQLPPPRPRAFGLPSDAPPEEFHALLGPRPAADAFRLGVLLARLLDDVDPLGHVAPLDYLAGTWRVEPGPEARARPAVVDLLETLVQHRDVDRPRGELLSRLIARVAPADARQRVAALVSRLRPPRR